MLNTYGEAFSTTFEVEDGTAVSIGEVREAQEGRLTVRAEDGVLIIESNTERDIAIYLANGMLVRRVRLTEGQNTIADLKPDIYIVAGMKFVLRY